MSYGEPSSRPSYGRFMDLLRHVVDERNVTFVSRYVCEVYDATLMVTCPIHHGCCSAGNAGPALTTVGAPGGSHPCVIGVGAAVTQAMMSDQYSLRRSDVPPAAGDALGVESDAATTTEKHRGEPRRSKTPGAPSQQATMHDRAEDTTYTWSSRGPGADGALGGTFVARLQRKVTRTSHSPVYVSPPAAALQ